MKNITIRILGNMYMAFLAVFVYTPSIFNRRIVRYFLHFLGLSDLAYYQTKRIQGLKEFRKRIFVGLKTFNAHKI